MHVCLETKCSSHASRRPSTDNKDIFKSIPLNYISESLLSLDTICRQASEIQSKY